MTEDALRCVQPDMRCDEAGFLAAFDLNRELMHAAAAKAFGRARRDSYDLVSTDF